MTGKSGSRQSIAPGCDSYAGASASENRDLVGVVRVVALPHRYALEDEIARLDQS